jgi:hypothetical protein
MSSDEMVQLYTLAGVFAVGAIAIFVVRALRTSTFPKAQELYKEEEFVEARRAVLLNYENSRQNSLTFNVSDEQAALVCCKMDELARMTSYVGEEKMIEEWGAPIGKSWMILDGFVYAARNRDGDENKWIAFQNLAEKAIEKHNIS